MIRIGVCTDIGNIDKVAAAGFDYLEYNLTCLAKKTEEEFERILAVVETAPIGVESCNGMLPGDLKVTGPEVNAQALHDYLDLAFTRAEKLGVKVVVFGSGAARGVPEGFDTAQGWRQIANFLRLAEKHAAEHGITVAIEPLRSVESNVINYVSEAVLLASLVQMPHIGALGDTYHMAMGGESFKAFTMAGPLLKHVHVANSLGRKFPAPGDGEKYDELFETLSQMGYEGRVSIEAHGSDFDTEVIEGFRALNAARQAALNR